jgi:dihydropteroate synthase-like protein
VPEKILFVTGKLAEPALRRTLAALSLPAPYEVAVLKISVAALMTTGWIARHLRVPPGCTRIVIPGLCAGDLEEIARATGLVTVRGPDDLQDLPIFFGRERSREGYGQFSAQLVAEVQDATRLDDAELLARAAYFRASGADVVDLGVGPGVAPAEIARPTRLLKQAGYRVSCDSMDPETIRAADAAGCDLVLSLNGPTLELARELRATPVIVPDDEGGVASLWRSAERLWAWGLDGILDPIVQPIGFGFARSLDDLYQTRQRYPEAKLMMGAHHLSELTDADSTGINALLAGIAQELGVSHILTTEVAPWARGSVRQLDIARRLMHYALAERVLPRRLEEGLLTTRDSRPLRHAEDELREMQAQLRDANVRIFVGEDRIFAFNADVFASGSDPHELFAQLGVEEPGHAFYLGRELAKAQLALQLGKSYHQDRPLRWGYLSADEPPAQPRRVRLTSRRRKKDQPDE